MKWRWDYIDLIVVHQLKVLVLKYASTVIHRRRNSISVPGISARSRKCDRVIQKYGAIRETEDGALYEGR